jgi:hypothetical protein
MTEPEKPKTPRVTFDARGAFLESVTFSFYGKAKQDAWRSLVEATKMRVDDEDAPEPFRSVNFVALPAEIKKNAFFLRGGAHQKRGRNLENLDVHWHFDWDRAPERQPPPRMRQRSGEVGGYPHFLENFVAKWPAAREVEGEVKGRYLVDATRWSLAFEHRAGLEDLAQHIGDFTVKRNTMVTMWSIAPASGPVDRLLIADFPNQVQSISTFGTYRTRLETRILEDLDEALWKGLGMVLRPRSIKEDL